MMLCVHQLSCRSVQSPNSSPTTDLSHLSATAVERKAELFVTELLLKFFYIEVTLCSLCLLVVIYHQSPSWPRCLQYFVSLPYQCSPKIILSLAGWANRVALSNSKAEKPWPQLSTYVEADFSDGRDGGGNNDGVVEAAITPPPAAPVGAGGGGGGGPEADRVEG